MAGADRGRRAGALGAGTARADRRQARPLVLQKQAFQLRVLSPKAYDLVFAVDSIPAVFAITRDTFIVYTSNVCAILGLRSLYFLLAKLIDRFTYLKTGLALVLAFVGIKMIVADYFPIPTPISLALIVIILGVTIAVSVIVTRKRSPVED